MTETDETTPLMETPNTTNELIASIDQVEIDETNEPLEENSTPESSASQLDEIILMEHLNQQSNQEFESVNEPSEKDDNKFHSSGGVKEITEDVPEVEEIDSPPVDQDNMVELTPPDVISIQAHTEDTTHLTRAFSEITRSTEPKAFKMTKFASMPSIQRSMTFRLNQRPKSTGNATRGELQRFLSSPLQEEGDIYGSTSNDLNVSEKIESKTPLKEKSTKKLKGGGRLNRDRGMDDTKWDYVLVFPNPEYEKEKKEKEMKYPFIPTMNDMLTKLRQSGLDTQLSKSTNMDMENVPKEKYIPPYVYCKLSASIERLKVEASRVHMSIGLVENKLERMAKQGEVRFHIENPEDRITEIKRQGHEPLPPEKVTKIARRSYKPIQYEIGREIDIFDTFDLGEVENMDLEDPESPTIKKKTQSPFSALIAMLKPFRYKPYQYIHMAYTPQENVQNLYGTPLFPSIKRIRLIESIIRSVHGAGLDLDMLVQYGAIAGHYPMHDDDSCRDIRSMWSTSLWLTHQPIEATRNYFGEQAALYLAYVAHITRWLLFPSIFSISLFFTSHHYLVWVFGIIMVLWSTLFLKMWKRKLSILGMKWGMSDFHAQEHDRPEYDENINRYMPSNEFGSIIFLRRIFSLLIFLFFLFLILLTKGILFYFRWLSHKSPEHFQFNIPMYQNKTIILFYDGEFQFIAIINVFLITFWSYLFKYINHFLTNIEIHHKETSKQQFYIIKLFLFEFLNNYSGILYIAFLKSHFEGDINNNNNNSNEPDNKAINELSDYMLYIYGFQFIFYILIHLILPYFILFQKKKNKNNYLSVENEFLLYEYGWKGLYHDYINMIIQFGYATMFVVSCPYLPLMAFLFNLVLIRTHSISLVTRYRRLTPRSAQHIRLCTILLELICILSILTNSWSVVIKGNLILKIINLFQLNKNYFIIVRFIIILFLFLFLFGIGKIFSFFINDIPTHIQIQLERQEYYITKVLHLGYQWDKRMHSILNLKSQEILEIEEGYGWDFAIVFPNPEVRRPQSGKMDEIKSMREMILKLHQAGLQVQFFESTAKVSSFIPSMVLCKIRANQERLEMEANRVKMPLKLNPKELEFQANQGVITTLYQRIKKHIQEIENEIKLNNLNDLFLKIKSITENNNNEILFNGTWEQLLAQLYLTLNDMISIDKEIRQKFIELNIDLKRHITMIRLNSLSEELIEPFLFIDSNLIENKLIEIPNILENVSCSLQQASKDIGILISLLPILIPNILNQNFLLPENILKKNLENLSISYLKLIPLIKKINYLIELTLPLNELKKIELNLEKKNIQIFDTFPIPNKYLHHELNYIQFMINDTTLNYLNLRKNKNNIKFNYTFTIKNYINNFINSIILNPMIDIFPFYIKNPNLKYKSLASIYRYDPYENIYMAYQNKKELQHWYNKKKSLHGPMQLFNSTERLTLIESIITDPIDGSGFHLDKLLLNGAIKGYFPLHDDHMKKDLWKKWKYSINQPIEEIRGYFGIKIGLYFAYLGHYTKWLAISAIVGLIVYIIQILQRKYFPPQFATSLNWVKILAVPIYGIFIIIWATLFLKYWRRKQWIYSMHWGMSEFHEEEQVRPQFQGELMRDPISGKRMKYFSDKQRRWRLLFSWFILIILIFIVLIFVGLIFLFRYYSKENKIFNTKLFGNIGTQCAALANVGQIFILSQVYNYVSNSLNEFENHRTDSQYENHFVAKAIIFQFVNNFALLFYVAFLKQSFEINGCVDKDCMAELQVSLTYVYASQLIIGNCQEVIMPLFWSYIEYLRHEWVKKSDQQEEIVSQVEKQFFMPEYGWIGTFWDYLEMIIQFGYSTFFVLACPLAPVFSFCNNIFEIRIDGSKISKFSRRPRPSGASTIGQWIKVLDVFVIITIITNSWIITTTSKFGDLILPLWPRFDAYFSQIGLFFTLAGLLLGLKIIINNIIPDMPRHVHAQLKRQKFIVSKILSTHEEPILI